MRGIRRSYLSNQHGASSARPAVFGQGSILLHLNYDKDQLVLLYLIGFKRNGILQGLNGFMNCARVIVPEVMMRLVDAVLSSFWISRRLGWHVRVQSTKCSTPLLGGGAV